MVDRIREIQEAIESGIFGIARQASGVKVHEAVTVKGKHVLEASAKLFCQKRGLKWLRLSDGCVTIQDTATRETVTVSGQCPGTDERHGVEAVTLHVAVGNG